MLGLFLIVFTGDADLEHDLAGQRFVELVIVDETLADELRPARPHDGSLGRVDVGVKNVGHPRDQDEELLEPAAGLVRIAAEQVIHGAHVGMIGMRGVFPVGVLDDALDELRRDDGVTPQNVFGQEARQHGAGRDADQGDGRQSAERDPPDETERANVNALGSGAGLRPRASADPSGPPAGAGRLRTQERPKRRQAAVPSAGRSGIASVVALS